MQQITSVGLTGDRKNSARAQKRFFSPRSLENLVIGGSNQVKISPNFVGTITKDLVNIPTKVIDESLHGLGGIEEIPRKNGVFSRTQEL